MEEEGSMRRAHHLRILDGLRQPHNWKQLLRFTAVGVGGYVLNLMIYAVAVHGIELNYLVASFVAFVIAVSNNFWWNRHWTFDAGDGHAGFQAFRFFIVSAIALAINLVALKFFVSNVGMSKLMGQAVAVICATPVNFIGHKMWSFG